jgi:hypothetical protein
MSLFEVNDNQYTQNFNTVVIPENGSSFKEGKRMRFVLDPQSGFIDPNSSFLRFDINRTGSGSAGSVPEPSCGGHALLRDVMIYSGDGTNLEEMLDYNVWVNQELNLSNDDGYKETRNNIEGCIFNTKGDDNSLEINDIVNNKYSKSNANGSKTPLTRKVCIPLYGGLFKSNTVIPVTALNGLRLDIQLDDNVNRCLRSSSTLEATLNVNNIDLSLQNSNYIVLDTTANGGCSPADINTNLAYGVGDVITFDNGDYTISSIQIGKPNLVCPPYTETDDRVIIQVTASNFPNKNYPSPTIKFKDDNSLSYEVSNPVLVIRKVIPEQNYLNAMMSRLKSKGLSFDIRSFNNLKNSISSDALQSATLLNSFHSRALALLSVQQSQSNNKLSDNLLKGHNALATNYVYNIKGKQVPSRRVNLSRYNIDTTNNNHADKYICNDVEHISETDKAWRNAGVVVRNLRNQQNNISYDRSLSNYGGSMDLRGANPQLQVQYNAGGGAKLMNTFVSHIRNISITPNEGIVVST